jgi:hypothetical protein
VDTIPVKDSAKEALTLPFKCFAQFLRLCFWPMLIVWVSQFIGGALAVVTEHRLSYVLWWLVYGITIVPFSISWTRLVVLGAASNTDRSSYTFGKKEFKYLSVSLAIIVLFFGPLTLLMIVANSIKSVPLPLVFGCVVLVTELAVAIRFTFILPAIALDSYKGLKAAWRQTRSVALRIMAVIFLSGLPINCATSILHTIEKSSADQPPLFLIVLGTVDVLLLFLSAAVTAGALAVSFRQRMNLASSVSG